MIYRLNILLLLFLFCIPSGNAGQYLKDISLMVRDRKSDLIFLHEYYGFFDTESQKIRKRAYLEILSSAEGSQHILENSPLFTHLYWFSKEEVLVALSTISSRNNPQIVLYGRNGRELGRKFVSCKNDLTDENYWCHSELNKIYWFQKTDPDVDLKVGKEGVSVCVDQNCFSVNYGVKSLDQ